MFFCSSRAGSRISCPRSSGRRFPPCAYFRPGGEAESQRGGVASFTPAAITPRTAGRWGVEGGGARVPDCSRALLHFIHLFVALCQCVLLALFD